MKNKEEHDRPLGTIAKDYFDYVGSHLPQQCANDEFYFLPRAESAIQHLDHLDDLTPERIQDHIRYVQTLLSETRPKTQDDLEVETDRHLLRQSMESFVREFSDAQGWRHDPTLYVKIPLFATDQILSQSEGPQDRLRVSLSTLFSQIPSFLHLAARNLQDTSETSLHVALDMVQDTFDFHRRDIQAFITEKMGGDKELLAKNQAAFDAWEQYKRDLAHLPSQKSFAVGEGGLRRILDISLGYSKSPGEILEIAREAYHKTDEKIQELARQIDNRKTWQLIISEQIPFSCSSQELMALYQKEVQNLRCFFYDHDLVSVPPGERVTVLQTPSYLQSLRATASYRAPLTGDTNGHGIFYITPGNEDLELISLHCPYLSAHETYPGHHILDHLRVHHANPIRRQTESPLFYEGWACYVEQLLNEFGYITDPRQELVHLKRLLWRTVRAQLDVELQTGKISLAEGTDKTKIFGFSPGRRRRQVRRFALTPGYQLCYFMGMHEIIRLRKRFSSRFGLKRFHDILLGGGQIPFDLVERRLKASLRQNKPEYH